MNKAASYLTICIMLISILSRYSLKSKILSNIRSKSPSYSTSTILYVRNIYQVSEEELTKYILDLGQPKFRASQVKNWLYSKGAVDFEVMKDVPAVLRKSLSSEFVFGDLSIASEQVSKDGTCKRAYELHDGQLIESVLMPYEDGRRTACISSQAGCAMGCVFCATGQMGFQRQLTSNEIFEQAQKFAFELLRRNERLSNVVLMGMGEPLANYKNVMEAIRRMNTELGIGARHITISTSGIAPRIRALADEEMQIGLAISLHQTTNDKRSALMPINKKYPLEELLDACLYYTKTTKRRITFEWALIRNQTDTSETAHELGHLLTGMNCHVNVIPLNPTAGFGGKPTSKDGVSEFIRILETYGVPATPRTRRGIDIDAGCGQLKADLLRKRVQVGVVNPDVEVASIPGVIVGLTIDNNSSSSSGSDDSVTLGSPTSTATTTTSTSLLSTATSNKSSSSNVVKVNAVDGSTDEDTSFDQLLNSGVIWKPSVNNN